ncbi:MAG: hypothetical protein IKQ75_02445 [Bacteroidales bacterium]|nr:hypothetical protein [Bacteroidales bacterium]MBR6160708.1 hypothetical protein [Bacteroidales bacterium]
MTELARTTLFGILKLIPFAIATAIIISMWIGNDVGFFIFVFFWWLWIPALIVSIVLFFASIRCRDKWQLTIVLWGVVNILLWAVFCMLPNQKCTPDVMATHYNGHHTEMEEFHRYVQSAIADSCDVTVEFNGNKLERFCVKGPDKRYLPYSGKEAGLHKDSLMTIAGLSSEEYDNICKQLKDMGCIGFDYSQSTPEQLRIWFRRVGWGLYCYTVLNRPMTNEEKASAMNGVVIPYNDHCYFSYQGGAAGQETFTEKEREYFLKKHKPW